MDNIYEGEVISSIPEKPTLAGLNSKAIYKLGELLDNIDGKTDPAMVTAVTDAIAKLNTSLKGSDILPKEETEAERRDRETKEALASAMRG